MSRRDGDSPLTTYTRASQRAAGQIIGVYSTSFGAATALLGRRHRSHVRNVYALVRVADELVDGVGREAALPEDRQRDALDELEQETASAIASGYSSNPIVHAFAHTARAARFSEELTAPFFSSMRTDQSPAPAAGPAGFADAEHARYVHGSAEVIGLMCLRVFVRETDLSPAEEQTLTRGAESLGAAFQNINFLRDLADDTDRLGRSYLSETGRLSAADKAAWIAVVREQLATARASLRLLPADARRAVAAALFLFQALTDRLERADVDELYARRIRVPAAQKGWILTRSLMGGGA